MQTTEEDRDAWGIKVGTQFTSFVRPEDFDNKATGASAFGITVPRVYGMISTIEHDYFHVVDCGEDIADIREGYPVFQHEEARRKLEEGIPLLRSEIMTLDFVITRSGSTPRYVVRSVKHSAHLRKKSVIARLLRERWVAQQRGWGWKLVTEKNLNACLADNAYKINCWIRDAILELDSQLVGAACAMAAKSPPGTSFQAAIERVAKSLKIDEESARGAICAGIRTRCLPINWKSPLDLLAPIPLEVS